MIVLDSGCAVWVADDEWLAVLARTVDASPASLDAYGVPFADDVLDLTDLATLPCLDNDCRDPFEDVIVVLDGFAWSLTPAMWTACLEARLAGEPWHIECFGAQLDRCIDVKTLRAAAIVQEQQAPSPRVLQVA